MSSLAIPLYVTPTHVEVRRVKQSCLRLVIHLSNIITTRVAVVTKRVCRGAWPQHDEGTDGRPTPKPTRKITRRVDKSRSQCAQ